MQLISLWFGLRAPVSRQAYALSGFGLMAFKYGTEAVVIHQTVGRWLSPLAYLNPVLAVRLDPIGEHEWLLAALALWTLPFLWIGVSMTLRRLEDAGRSPLLAALYFVPLVNYVLMLTLCVLPSRRPAPGAGSGAPPRPGDGLRSALQGVGIGALLALGLVLASVQLFGTYGTTLFVATPFLMGAASAYRFNRDTRRPLGVTVLVAVGSVALAGGAILLFALEGVLCLAMAAPLGLVLAVLGALLGRNLPRRFDTAPVVSALGLPLALFAGLDATQPRPPEREVVTTVEVEAPPSAVWPNVVAFSELDAPPAWFFRLGVAYPRRATIRGRGVGALRRCEFSTGAFLEPITVWDEPSHLGFDVQAQPPPMHELSPYRLVLAPHLDGYLGVRSGEFRLRALPGGRTRLEGRTRYELRVFPGAYWGLWSDALIHAIHRRVLEHVARAAEPPRRS